MPSCHQSVNNILKKEVREGKGTRSSGSSIQHGVAVPGESLETLARAYFCLRALHCSLTTDNWNFSLFHTLEGQRLLI